MRQGQFNSRVSNSDQFLATALRLALLVSIVVSFLLLSSLSHSPMLDLLSVNRAALHYYFHLCSIFSSNTQFAAQFFGFTARLNYDKKWSSLYFCLSFKYPHNFGQVTTRESIQSSSVAYYNWDDIISTLESLS